MERRVAPIAALFIVLSVASAAFAAVAGPGPAAIGAVTWPASTLLISEVQTGGASASDEFAEITNVGPAPVDLAGLELVYVTSSGGTITRKASWSASTMLDVGRHLFVANASGIYAALADATYSGGFAAAGGALALRPIGGAPIDAVGWGDATSGFVEGAPMAAPSAGASIERRPGGIDGNTTDTNSNSADFFSQVAPNPQSLAAPPVPAPGASPTPTPVPTPTSAPTDTPLPTGTPLPTDSPLPTDTLAPTDSPAPTGTPTAEPTPSETAAPTDTPAPSDVIATPTPEPTLAPTPTPEPTIEPTPEPTPAPTPTIEPTIEPTPIPSATPTPTSVPTATPEPITPIAEARLLPDDSTVRISGVLTTALGALEDGRKAFIQDASGGIALYLDATVTTAVPAGMRVTVTGSIDDRFAERTLRITESGVVVGLTEQLPVPLAVLTGAVGEAIEGLDVIVEGTTVGSPSTLSDGLGLMVDDGTGQLRAVIGAEALGGLSAPAGTRIRAHGPVGQRDSSGTGLAGYRIHAVLPGAFEILPTPTPTPTPTGTPAPTAAPSPTPNPTPTATPRPTVPLTPSPAPTVTASPVATASPAPRPSPIATPEPTPPPALTIVEARGTPVGTVVTVSGVVTAEAGRLGLPPLIAIADGTGGIVVRVPDGVAAPARGATVLVRGPLADPYGQLELRPAASGLAVTGTGSLPAPLALGAADLGEPTEGRLATVTGTVTATPSKSTSGDITVGLAGAEGTPFRVVADASSGIAASAFEKGRTYAITGIVGQRASRKGALDGYRMYVRDRADIVAGATGLAAGGASPPTTPIATALAQPDGTNVAVEGTVTAGVALLDASGRRIVVQDASGAIEVLLPAGSGGPAIGMRLRVTGTTGRAWGAPRVVALTVDTLGMGAAPSATDLGRAPGERDEWELVRLSGTVVKVERLGDRWRAEIQLATGAKVPVQGQAGAGIPSTAIISGRRITVTGIVKRPYPTASDRRYAVLPRSGADVAIGPASGTGATVPVGDAAGAPAGVAGVGSGAAGADITPDTDLAALGEHVGERVRVGGLVARAAGDGFDLDDGTAIAHVVLRDDMAALIGTLHQGEAVAATGTVEFVSGAPAVIVDDAGTLVRVGTLGQALPIGGSQDGSSSSPDADSPDPAAGVTDIAFGGGMGPAGLFILALVTTLAVTAGTLRRRLERRRIRATLVKRLATLGPRSATPAAATLANAGPAERGHA